METNSIYYLHWVAGTASWMPLYYEQQIQLTLLNPALCSTFFHNLGAPKQLYPPFPLSCTYTSVIMVFVYIYIFLLVVAHTSSSGIRLGQIIA